jgi:hypothetical protein
VEIVQAASPIAASVNPHWGSNYIVKTLNECLENFGCDHMDHTSLALHDETCDMFILPTLLGAFRWYINCSAIEPLLDGS